MIFLYMKKIVKTDQEWKEILSNEEYYITRQKGTEPAFSGKYDQLYDKGDYVCKGCGEKLFEGESKFDSGCGWPSFSKPVEDDSIEETLDTSGGRIRTEITCAKCDGHMGHVFDDGPTSTGKRYCVNSVSIEFKKRE